MGRNGEKQRSRTISRYGKGDGKFCDGSLKEVDNCNVDTNPAPTPEPEQPCAFSDWQPTECTHSCGGGTRTLSRHVESGHCTGELEKVEKCNMEACPVCIDCIKVCKWGQWEHWDSCTKCGGQRKRTRQMHSHAVRNHHKDKEEEDRRLEHIPTEILCDPGASEET